MNATRSQLNGMYLTATDATVLILMPNSTNGDVLA